MASPQPPGDPNRPGASGDGLGGSGPSGGKADPNASNTAPSPAQLQQQQVIDMFGADMYTAAFTMVLVLLGLMQASFNQCTC